MFESFAAYAEWIEVETFFSGSLIILGLSRIFSGNTRYTGIAYALVATLYWGLQIKNYYPDIQEPFLKGWASLAILFWIPAIRKKPALLFVHCIVFFLLMIYSLYQHVIANPDPSLRDNDLKIFATSLAINSCSMILIYLLKSRTDKSQQKP